MHYVIWKCPDPAKLGATKLNKILWLADTRAYVLHKRPITGATYMREKYGPVAKAMMPAREALESEHRIRHWRAPLYNHVQDVFKAKMRPDLSQFDDRELHIIDQMISYVCEEHTAASISEETHDYVWEIAKMGEEIPYYAVFAARTREPTEEELEWAKAEARRQGLLV